jgi:hypothetical protein
MKPAANPGEWIDGYLEKKDPELRKVADALRGLLKKTVQGCSESVNPWKIPTFESNGPMCILLVRKKHVTFGFLRGTSLPDPGKLLEGTGKNLRHVKLRNLGDLRNPALTELIVAATKLNTQQPMEGMKPKKTSW